jgi:hypothetical protein
MYEKVIERLPWNTAQHEYSTCSAVGLERDTPVIGSSEQVHVVDALAITGDEGRGSLRKASGSWQTSFDPKMSEWGNPLRMEYP